MVQVQKNWHQLFGLLVQDFFTGTPCEVELERDLSVKSQFLDVIILHKPAVVLDRALPDGLEVLTMPVDELESIPAPRQRIPSYNSRNGFTLGPTAFSLTSCGWTESHHRS